MFFEKKKIKEKWKNSNFKRKIIFLSFFLTQFLMEKLKEKRENFHRYLSGDKISNDLNIDIESIFTEYYCDMRPVGRCAWQ